MSATLASRALPQMCFKVGKYLTTKHYDEYMKMLAQHFCKKENYTQIEWCIQFTEDKVTDWRTMSADEVGQEIDKLVDAIKEMPTEVAMFIASDYLSAIHRHCQANAGQ